jgi:hypothetical protein
MSLGKYSGKTGDVTGIFKGSIIFKFRAVLMGNNLVNMPSSRVYNLGADVTGKNYGFDDR